MSEKKSGGCLKVGGTIVVIVLLVGVVLGGVGLFVWKKWGAEKFAEIAAQAEDEMAAVEAAKNMAKRPVVSSATISADREVYDRYTKRDDVLVMVEYYSDT